MATSFFFAWLVFVTLNILTFSLFGIDKKRAEQGHWRISEQTLIGCSMMGGWPGAYAGRAYFRHKTRKQPFCSVLRTASILNVAGLVSLTIWGLA